MSTDWTLHFSGLEAIDALLRGFILERSAVVNLPEGHRIFGPGQSAANYLLLLDGSVRVQ